MIFRATSYHCKLALQVDQCNNTFTSRFVQSRTGRADFTYWELCGAYLADQIQPAITYFSAGEFRRRSALSENSSLWGK